MTTEEIRLKEQFDQRLKEKELKYLVLGYTISENGEMIYHSIGCTNEEARDRNMSKLVNAKYYELKEVL